MRKLFELAQTDKQGVSRRAYLEQAERSTKKRSTELDLPEYPHELSYLVDWYMQLDKQRSSSMGVSPLSWLEIEAWSRLLLVPIRAWEVKALVEIDGARMAVHAEAKRHQG